MTRITVLIFALAMLCMVGGAANADLNDGLVAYYPFNANANDETGNGHDGTVNGPTLATDRFGNSNSAYSFDGSSHYVEIPDDDSFDFGTGGFSICAWIKTDATTTSASGRDDILAKGDPTISGFAISMRNNKAVLWIGPSGEFYGSSVINDGQWHQIVGTRDDSGNVVLYIDSIAECTGNNNQNVDTHYSAFIGKHGTSNESYFDGFIDDVRIYNRGVAPRGVFLLPSSQTGYDVPGVTVPYAFELTNKTGSEDSFDISVSDNAWATSLSVGNTGTIADGESVSFTAEAEIPASASIGDTDVATINATSVTDPAITDTATVTTRVIKEGDYADDFGTDCGLWSYRGAAYRDEENGYVVLTKPLGNQSGIIWLNDEFTSSFSAQFRYKVGGGSGSDGFVFMFYKTKDYEPADGGALAFNGGQPDGYDPGYGIEFDSWQNSAFDWEPPPVQGDPSANHIALIKDRTDNHLVVVDDARCDDNQWHQVNVTVDSNAVAVEVDGDQVLGWEGAIDRAFGGLGFGAATGGGTNWHIIDDVRISRQSSHLNGDINDDRKVDLADAILALQVLANLSRAGEVTQSGDVNGDNKIGLQEAIYALQEISGFHNHPPELNPIGNKTVEEGSPLSFVISAFDADGHTLTYSAASLPHSATFDPSSKTFSWTPSFLQSGTYDVTFSVTDIFAAPDSETITITVNDYDATGTWNYSITNNWVNPGNAGCTADRDETGSVTVTQTGDSVTVVYDGITYAGSVSGATYTFSASYPEEGGTTTVTITFTLSSSTSGSGTLAWSWTAGIYWCNGGGDITITK